MKKIVLTILCFTIFGTALMQGQAVKKVMVEEHTNASCPPCASQNPAFDALMEANKDIAVLLKYQVWWPGYDPMYEQNTEDVDERTGNYYSVSGAPNVRVDGSLNAGVAANVTQFMLEGLASTTTPLEIKLDHEVSADLDTVNITCIIKNVDTVEFNPGNTVAHVVIVEESIQFDQPPGSTNETHFIQVMRKMLPSALGTTLGPIAAGDSVVLTFSEITPGYFYNYGEIGAVAFVQNNTTKGVYQSEISEAKPLSIGNDDVSLVVKSVGPQGLCDYNLEPKVEVTNEGEIDITEIEASYAVNDGVRVFKTSMDTLAPGESIEIVFDPATLDPGTQTHTVTYGVKVNGHRDLDAHNNALEPDVYELLQQTPVFSEQLTEGFETTANTEAPENTILKRGSSVWDMAVLDENAFGTPPPDPLGAYGQSNKSVLVRFWFMAPGASSEMIFEKIDLTGRVNSRISFDHTYTYRPRIGRNDRFQVLVSSDCGVSWEAVYDKQGTELETQPSWNGNFYTPVAGDWVSDTIDISSYDGAEELTIRLVATSDNGNNLYFDNINLTSQDVLNGTEDLNALEGSFEIYPNPTANEATIEFELEESNTVSVDVYDITGKLVDNILSDQKFNAGKYMFSWKGAEQSGIYFVKIRTLDGEVSKKITVVK